ncbi:lytic transglycosylase domain-containing protein [Comamonas terrigena]|jgi:soluble lytic murein transglycosylase|uniref:lytic transglycosylase domain-containing protein n=1 Tax=Comamonas terrigena TaxID=32013 RepID=UPI00244BE670|nr:lytic transglycosylase domain-containing protein [Comamonas terrigena]MDH0049354.1 lytic transglycosylase domain-containing protein [Comamonas terrigena]MDH0511018.1 lytic transglycosylase domain-containing protein [Comamonas terrigena]MDH1090620.1 lytic transglycosylase domain-containing protein [Comamonas terrigena]
MHWLKILTPLCAASLLSVVPSLGFTQTTGDDVLLQMQQAFRKGDKAALARLLPAAQGHALEPWAAYWELRVRLDSATPQEVQAFLQRWRGTYQEDRLRNDWLLQLGKNRDWTTFAQQHADFRMQDDREVRCYALTADLLQGKAPQNIAQEAVRLWHTQGANDDGCANLAATLYANKQLKEEVIWQRARLGAELNRQGQTSRAVGIVAPEMQSQVGDVFASPIKYLSGTSKNARGNVRRELALLAIIRVAANDPSQAADQMNARWANQLRTEERNWAWGVIGKMAARKLDPTAVTYFDKVTRSSDLDDDALAWKTRAALRAGNWSLARKAIDGMSSTAQADPSWVYWKAKAIASGRVVTEHEKNESRALFERIAGVDGFYEQLALEELGQRVTVPPAPQPLTPAEKEAAEKNPSLSRALYAIRMGLRSEGVREWNYATNLHDSGGMGDRALYAAADRACRAQVWDRCINTSERTRGFMDWKQRYPMPFQETVLARSGNIGLDPAYVYGLIRQESRFIMDARSGVGASGLMQVMPATAKWTARKIGMNDFTPGMINDRDVNIQIGTAYLKLALDDFQGSMAMAAAGYNAGPGRPRNWRNGPVLDGEIWAENVPFTETRDYVKKVLANTTNYAALITGQPQSLRARLGTVGPKPVEAPADNAELP